MELNVENFSNLIIEPNVEALLREPDNMRAAVNAVHSIDDFAGILALQRNNFQDHDGQQDGQLRNRIARDSEAFRAVRDCSFTLKHGFLRPNPPRIVRTILDVVTANAVWDDENIWDDSLCITDELVVIKFSGLDISMCRADVVVREAWSACAAEKDGCNHEHSTLEDLTKLGVLDVI